MYAACKWRAENIFSTGSELLLVQSSAGCEHRDFTHRPK